MDNDKIKVSVLVPVYNVEKYLARCLDSIIHQTLNEIEIIVINDGSTDNSLTIIKCYAMIDKRIIVIDKENSGYGNSMNHGLAIAKGEYIGIVESDDFISHKMFAELYKMSENATVDIIKGNFYDVYDDENGWLKPVRNCERDSVKKINEIFTLKEDGQISYGHPSVWSAIYRNDFLKENNIKFKEVKGGGWVDNPFFYETLCMAKSIKWTDTPYYYYYKGNLESSSNKQCDPSLPFVRMNENLDIIEKYNFKNDSTYICTASRVLLYLYGVLNDFDFDANKKLILENANKLMRRLDEDIINNKFNDRDNLLMYKYASPIDLRKTNKNNKILIYNWVPFDNPQNIGGGVTVYIKNLIKEILTTSPYVQVYVLSSGWAYDATRLNTFFRKIGNCYGNRVCQYEIVNSPVPAEQRFILSNPIVALKNNELKRIFAEFLDTYGPFKAIHFNNLEGISLDVMDLKENYPNTRFIYSLHNYVPMCLTGFYYMRHKHCICNSLHTAEDCIKCSSFNSMPSKSYEIYRRGVYNQDINEVYTQEIWLNKFGLNKIDENCDCGYILEFQKVATEKINKNMDTILAVSKRVKDIAIENGYSTDKLKVSYIGTEVARYQMGKASTNIHENKMQILFLGNDYYNEEKGYPFLIKSLKNIPQKYAEKINLVFTVRQNVNTAIKSKLKHFNSIRIINGYTHEDLPEIFKGCNLSIVPVLWEDNLPQIAIESVAYGVPVLASLAGGASELSDSDLFKFNIGNSEDLCNKIIHFLNNPEDLQDYWEKHNGLVTMKQHWEKLSKEYGIDIVNQSITFENDDYVWLLKEHDFLLELSKSAIEGNSNNKGKVPENGRLHSVFEKNQLIMDTVQCLMAKSSTNESLENVCLQRGYKNIVIYGYGVLGKCVYRDLKDSKINVVAIMDGNINGVKGAPSNVPLIGIDQKLPKYDSVIVTAVAAYEVIEKKLSDKGCKNIVNILELTTSDVNEL